jgi:hypothetical protein
MEPYSSRNRDIRMSEKPAPSKTTALATWPFDPRLNDHTHQHYYIRLADDLTVVVAFLTPHGPGVGSEI